MPNVHPCGQLPARSVAIDAGQPGLGLTYPSRWARRFRPVLRGRRPPSRILAHLWVAAQGPDAPHRLRLMATIKAMPGWGRGTGRGTGAGARSASLISPRGCGAPSTAGINGPYRSPCSGGREGWRGNAPNSRVMSSTSEVRIRLGAGLTRLSERRSRLVLTAARQRRPRRHQRRPRA